MKNRFIVCVDNSTKSQDNQFIEFLNENRLGWWHYLQNTWMIVDSSGQITITDLRDYAKEAFDNEYNMCFQLYEGEGTWSGFGPTSDNRNMFKWIRENWN